MRLTRSGSLLLLLPAFLGIVLLACASSSTSASGDPCSAKSKCSADKAVTAEDTADCKKSTAGACSSQYAAVVNCAVAKQTCTAANVTDEMKLATDCKAEFEAYGKCTSTKVEDAGTGG